MPTGTYLIQLEVDGQKYERELEVQVDPDYPDASATEEEPSLLEWLMLEGDGDQ